MDNLSNNIAAKLDKIIESNKMLDHPFYQAWNRGELSLEALQEYAKQYYHFVQEFPTYISATHANTPSLSVRQELLENLMEEEKGDENHPALWVRFMNALGVSEEDAQNTAVLPETLECLEHLRALARSTHYQAGISSLYAYESQIPEVAKVKIAGLKEYYGISDDHSLSFFTVHQEADVYHSEAEKNLIIANTSTQYVEEVVYQAAEKSSKAFLRLLDGVYNRYVKQAA